MTGIVADTHAIVWFMSGTKRLSATALSTLRRTIENNEPIYVSSISIIEVTYLVEKGRLEKETLTRMTDALQAAHTGLIEVPLNLAVARHLPLVPASLVPDMPDRIIAATASWLQCPLVTCDHKIRLSNIPTIW